MRTLSLTILVLFTVNTSAADKDDKSVKEPEWLVNARTETENRNIALQRHLDLQTTFELQMKFFNVGSIQVNSIFNMLQVLRDIAGVRVDLAVSTSDRVTALQGVLDDLKPIASEMKKQIDAGKIRPSIMEQIAATQFEINTKIAMLKKAEKADANKEPEWLTKVRAAKLDEVQKLQLKRHDALAKTLDLQHKFVSAGSWDVNSLFNILATTRQLAESRVELATTDADRITALEEVLTHAKSLELSLRARVNAGSERPTSLFQAEAGTLEIEILIAKEKKKAAK